MSLLKKIIFSAFVIVSLFLAVWAYKALQQNKKPSKEVLEVMPDSCIFYCSTKNFTELSIKLNSQNMIFNNWKSSKEIGELSASIERYDSLVYNNELIKDIVEDNRVHLAVYASSTGVHWLVGFSLKELKQEDELMQLLEKILIKKAEKSFVFGTHKLRLDNGVALISDSEELIDKGFSAGQKLAANKLFADQLNGIGNNEALQLYLNEQLHEKYLKDTPFNVERILSAKEIAANVKFYPTEIIVNGNYKPGDDFLQRIIASQDPMEMDIYDWLPFGTNCFRSISISSPKEFQTVMETAKGYKEFWNAINEKALYKVNNDVYASMNKFAVEFNSFIYKSLAIGINDTTKVLESLKFLSTADTLHAGVKIFDLNPGFVKAVFGGLFDMEGYNAFIYNDALYITSQMNAAIEIIGALQNNSTMRSNEAFMDYANDNLNEACNYQAYLAPNMNKALVRQFLKSSGDERKELYENISDANVIITKANDVYKFRMQINHLSPSTGSTPNLLWACALDTGSTQRPYLFVNHITKENELVIQDGSKQLYLINSTGKIVWKKKINEEIRSKVYTVDIFKNKKFQLLFNTDNYLHLIDRNGKYVDGYPVRLSSPATNAISLIDYEGKGDNRIFIACKNHLIYNYTLYGVRSEGYKPYKTDADVKLPVKFVRVGESDYLITIDEAGYIHAFSRKGDGRIGFKNRAIENCQDFILVATNNVNRTFLYYVDEKNNLINRVSFADKKDVVKLGADLTDARILFQNVNDDKTPDFTAAHVNGVYAYDINGVQLYSNSRMSVTDPVIVSTVGSKKMFYTYNSTKKTILSSSNANLQVQELVSESMPGVFDLYKNNKKYILYVNDGKLMCNLLR